MTESAPWRGCRHHLLGVILQTGLFPVSGELEHPVTRD